jgi:large subunit ribosomal protein L15
VTPHEIRADAGARRARKRVARGNAGSGGTYAGRGRKGQNARSGESRKPYFEGGQLPFVRRLPFKRGFNRIWKVRFTAVNLADLESRFGSGAEVTPDSLVAAGLLRNPAEPFKVLGNGSVSKPLTVHAHLFSVSAREGIGRAGGSCVDIPGEVVRPGLGRPHQRK